MNPNIPRGTPPLRSPVFNGGADLFSAPWASWLSQVGFLANNLPSISDLAAKMVPVGGGADTTDYTPDKYQRFFYYQTDTRQLYLSMLVSDVWTWVIVGGGTIILTVASPAALPSTLTPADAGTIAFEETYFHTYQWDGTAWRFAPGDPGAGYIVATVSGPPLGGLWQLCDGTSVNVSQGDGTVVSTATPNLMTSGNAGGPSLLGAGAPLGFNAATTPSWQALAATDTEAAHVHAISASIAVQSGAGANPAATGFTGAGTPHNHILSDANARLKAPSDSTDSTHGGGMPDRFYLEWYMRQ